MPVTYTYKAYITSSGQYDGGDSSYTTRDPTLPDNWSVTLENPFVFDGSEYNTLYLNWFGLINFTGPTDIAFYGGKTSQWAGFYIFGATFETPEGQYFIRYKQTLDTFVLIYNVKYLFSGSPSGSPFQVKITLYLKNHSRSGDVVADFGNLGNILGGGNSQFGVSFGTKSETNIIQNVNFRNYASTSPYTFTSPNSPNQNVTGTQSTYSGKQFVVSPVPPIPCFNSDSKILTDKGYIPIQDLRNGDLVKTLLNDYKPIVMIGKRDIFHTASKERIKDQLYKCSQPEYPEIFEDLILTGCHSILVDGFTSKEQREKVLEVNGDIFGTDSKYRLPACADEKASVYEIPGSYTIYHLALENENYYSNYGIYANGLLVETCSKRYLKELSNMTLVE